MSASRIELLVPRAPRDVWQALIQDAELTERGAMLRLVFSGGVCEATAQITRYESSRLLECCCDGKRLRWQLEPRDENKTLLIFTDRPETPTIAALLRGYGLFVLDPAKWLSSHHSG